MSREVKAKEEAEEEYDMFDFQISTQEPALPAVEKMIVSRTADIVALTELTSSQVSLAKEVIQLIIDAYNLGHEHAIAKTGGPLSVTNFQVTPRVPSLP